MEQWKRKIQWRERKYLYLIMAMLLGMVIYQQFLITDLQERMMNIEASCYDEQLNDIRYEAEEALRQNEEQGKGTTPDSGVSCSSMYFIHLKSDSAIESVVPYRLCFVH